MCCVGALAALVVSDMERLFDGSAACFVKVHKVQRRDIGKRECMVIALRVMGMDLIIVLRGWWCCCNRGGVDYFEKGDEGGEERGAVDVEGNGKVVDGDGDD